MIDLLTEIVMHPVPLYVVWTICVMWALVVIPLMIKQDRPNGWREFSTWVVLACVLWVWVLAELVHDFARRERRNG